MIHKPVNLLWTSGWDSTFRLLHLLLVQKRPVQPFYIMDPGRQSLQYELAAMDKLRALTLEKHPITKQLLLPTIYKEVAGIAPNEALTEQYKKISALKHLGAQYEWLARFAEEMNVSDLELSIETRSPGFFNTYVKPYIIRVKDGDYFNFQLQEDLPDPDIQFFKYFRYPIHELTKLDLQKLATAHEFIDMMNQTWFCHFPRKGVPCGICDPCRITMEEGLRRRIPMKGQMRHLLVYTIKPALKRLPFS